MSSLCTAGKQQFSEHQRNIGLDIASILAGLLAPFDHFSEHERLFFPLGAAYRGARGR